MMMASITELKHYCPQGMKMKHVVIDNYMLDVNLKAFNEAIDIASGHQLINVAEDKF